jgi:hypothetical protein
MMFGRQNVKRIGFSLWIGLFLLTACGQTTAVPAITSIPSTFDVPTIATQTSLSLTKRTASTPALAPGASVTPLPTIPTFTPTFDARTIVTVTPASQAECPKIDSAIRVQDYLPEKLEYPSPNTTSKILDFLNRGGDSQTLIARLNQIYPAGGDYRGGYSFYDITGDQSPELLYVEINYEGRLLVFSCKTGKYELLATLPEENDFLEYTMQIVDLNHNGVPEIIVMGTNGVSFSISTIYFYEWNGKTFLNLGHVIILALRQTNISDMDGNGTKEISFSGDNPVCTSCSNFIPQRQRTFTYDWNGEEFVEISNEFERPEYRFQAIQDADATVRTGKYDKAMLLYNQAISDADLEWWSPDRLMYEQTIHDPVTMFVATPSSMPTEDLTEYPRLAAYAYYRVMLLQLVQGNKSDSTTTYNSLQQQFRSNPYARPYVEVATAFWEAYQSTHEMYEGCAAAIQYAAEHPEILSPLGSDYHGWQSHIYVPEDVCPFR